MRPRRVDLPPVGNMVDGDSNHWLRFGDVVILPVAGDPDRVWMQHLKRGDGGQFNAQDLVDIVADYYERMF